jgi:hypothetical protein
MSSATALLPAKSKTLAAWLAFLGGPLGLHRFYLYGAGDLWGWLHPLPTALGLWGLERIEALGQDDRLSWLLLPLLGLQLAQTCLAAIVYGLQAPERWNARHNPGLAADAAAGSTGWITIGAVVCALMVGATALMSALAFSFERYYQDQVRAGLELSQ